MIEKREHQRPTITVYTEGGLAGHEFLMYRISASTWVAMRRGDLDDGGLAAAALESIIDSSLPEDTELDGLELLELMRAWVKAHREEAVPPAQGESLPEP